MSKAKLMILGCGTSTGVPVPGCRCAVCRSGKPRNQRFRTSALVTAGPENYILIDATADLRSQALRFDIPRVDAVLYTHAHADHILGTDDLRSFNFVTRRPIACFATATTFRGLQATFPYIFNKDPYYEGGLLAQLTVHEVSAGKDFEAAGLTVRPFRLEHGRTEVFGFRFGDLAYATDCNRIPEESLEILRGVKYLILDGLRYQEHRTHFTIPEAIQVATELEIPCTYLTHMTHSVDYDEVSAQLPGHVRLAYDGLEIEFDTFAPLRTVPTEKPPLEGSL